MTTTVVRPVAIKIDPDTKERVKRLAAARHRTPHWLMREAISQYVEREEKREAFRQDTLKAWDEYQTTGLHTPPEKVDAWLSSWGTDNELPAPACHK
ncbi:CopG family ribbon-helix-helix protein [Noviherbaspirillum sedimenti]|uniref:Ribbon-helix-helix protein, CopG family n=1 Tax=Noviherbaspirillum sedimenti TaxID=2320865 RepID=A0A3A3GMQ6_9BURK|nr:CopG family ribbon-helix-helix protein [Noviherbaspirillum sedimenti]RJG03576.1 ribbon-helix-helix protein, CopG family [Noviherbaspirillum sedimenti]